MYFLHSRRAWLFAVIVPVTLQCASLAKKIFDPPQVGVDKVEISKVDLTGVDLIVHVKIHNPNSVGATLNRIEYAFDIEGGIAAPPPAVRALH